MVRLGDKDLKLISGFGLFVSFLSKNPTQSNIICSIIDSNATTYPRVVTHPDVSQSGESDRESSKQRVLKFARFDFAHPE